MWPQANGALKLGRLCETTSSRWLSTTVRFKSPGSLPKHPRRPARWARTAAHRKPTQRRCRPHGRVRARRSSFRVDVRRDESIMRSSSRSPEPRHGCKVFVTANTGARWKSPDASNDAHVRRVLRFGYLAPDIVEAIVEGRQPRSLTVRRLLQG